MHFSLLNPNMSVFALAISCLTTCNLPWFMDLTFQVPMQYLLFIASDFASITSHIHNWLLFLLWFHLFILSGVISPLFSSSILGIYRHGEFIFQFIYLFAFSCCSWGSEGKNTEVFCHSLLQWTKLCRIFHHDPSIGWPYMAWLIISLC